MQYCVSMVKCMGHFKTEKKDCNLWSVIKWIVILFFDGIPPNEEQRISQCLSSLWAEQSGVIAYCK